MSLTNQISKFLIISIIIVSLAISGFVIFTNYSSSPSPLVEQQTNSASSQSSIDAENSTNTTSNQSKDECIVTISGTKYNVQELRTTHPGGDIYKCGTDMTKEYLGKHGQNTNRLAPYIVN